MGRFLDKLNNGDDFVGTLDSLGGSQLAEVMAESGFDLACLDTMFCAFDWEHLYNWSRASLNRGMDPMVRLPSHPWGGAPDSHVPAQVARAFGIGMTGVVVSLNTVAQTEELLEVSRTWHKNLHLHPFTKDSFEDYAARTAASNVLMPLIESEAGIENIDGILALEGLRVVWLGLSDISRMLGHPFDYEHDEVWDFIDHTTAKAAASGVMVCANAGYEFSRDIPTLHERIERMRSHGLRGIMLQNTGYMVQWMYRSILGTSVE
jgi:4-hydroxy-2-oxoheptanedioate aldolase